MVRGLGESGPSRWHTWGETIMRPLWAARLVAQGYTHCHEGTCTELVEIATADPVLCRDRLYCLSSEQGEDGLQATFVLRRDRVAVIEHQTCLTSALEI
jgi:hypothetical protein